MEKSAAEAISGLTLTADNYKEAVTILKKIFGNKQQIITKHMDILLSLNPVTSQYKLHKLQQLFDLVESHLELILPPMVAYSLLLCSRNCPMNYA